MNKDSRRGQGTVSAAWAPCEMLGEQHFPGRVFAWHPQAHSGVVQRSRSSVPGTQQAVIGGKFCSKCKENCSYH